MVVGWYHSHPGFGCWLSGVDVNTQQSFEALNQRAVAGEAPQTRGWQLKTAEAAPAVHCAATPLLWTARSERQPGTWQPPRR